MVITNLNGRKFYKIHSVYISRYISDKKFRYQERFLYSNGYSNRDTLESRREKNIKKRYKVPEYLVFEYQDNKLVELFTRIEIVPFSQRESGAGLFYVEQPDHPMNQTKPVVSEIMTPDEFNAIFADYNNEEIAAYAQLFQVFMEQSVYAKKSYESHEMIKAQSDRTKYMHKENECFCRVNRSK